MVAVAQHGLGAVVARSDDEALALAAVEDVVEVMGVGGRAMARGQPGAVLHGGELPGARAALEELLGALPGLLARDGVGVQGECAAHQQEGACGDQSAPAQLLNEYGIRFHRKEGVG